MNSQTKRIYLDHAATTPPCEAALHAMRDAAESGAYNASSLHAEGRRARAVLDDARQRVAAALNAAPSEIVFTSGGTESDNHALAGSVRARGAGARIVTVATEHHAVLRSAALVAEDGVQVTVLPVDSCGRVDETAFAAAIDERTIASVMYANNEIGTIAPIQALAQIARERRATFHTDAVAAGCWLTVDVRALSIDVLSLSAHKLYGPKGVGVLYVRRGTPLAALLRGGGQELGRRAGTENVVAIAGMAAALEESVRHRSAWAAQAEPLRDRLEAGIVNSVPAAVTNATGALRLPNIASVTFDRADAAALLARFDLAGIAVSAGSACTSGALERSHVIAAIGSGGERDATLRFSLGAATTGADIDRVLDVVPEAVAAARSSWAVPA